jgi:hypothetical protein
MCAWSPRPSMPLAGGGRQGRAPSQRRESAPLTRRYPGVYPPGGSWSEGCFLPSSNCRGFGAEEPAWVTGSGSACREQVQTAARGVIRKGGGVGSGRRRGTGTGKTAPCRGVWSGFGERRGRRWGAWPGRQRLERSWVAMKAASGAASESDADGFGERGLVGSIWSGLGRATRAASGSAAYLFPFSSVSCRRVRILQVAGLPLLSGCLLRPLFSRSLLFTGPAPRRFPLDVPRVPWLRLPRRSVATPLRALPPPFLFASLPSLTRTNTPLHPHLVPTSP